MMAEILDINTKGACTSSVEVVGATTISMYLKPLSGERKAYKLVLQLSPDNGATWITATDTIHEESITTVHVAATHARACVSHANERAATVNIFIVSAP